MPKYLPPRLAIGLLAVTLAVASAPAANNGAVYSDEVRAHLERVTQTPGLAGLPVTLILEADGLKSADLAALGGKLRFRHRRLHEVTVPGGRLAAFLSRLPANVLARFPYRHAPAAVVGQGIAITGAADMQALGHSGAGIKIGIIDLGFAKLSNAQATGDLPSNLTAVDYTNSGLGGTDHGTNVAEIAHQMAPAASLYLAKIDTETQLAAALNDMAAAGVKVINHSVAWFGAGFYDGAGPICDIVNGAEALGVQWVNAMGNGRQAHYLGNFTDSNGDLRHEFSGGQNYNTISLNAGSLVSLILNWNAYPETQVDYDLYLYSGNPDSGGTLVASSRNRHVNGTFPYPVESIDYTPATSGTYYIVVKKFNASQPNLPLTLFSAGPALGTYTTTSSIVQPADCVNVIGVGAVDLGDTAESFSSEGPTTDGRPKPEIAAPNRVQTSLTSSFAGTSAATPHATGAAALLLANSPSMTPAQLRTAMKAAVHDVSVAGYDYRTGYGRISLDADGDGLNRDDELAHGTSPTNPDTDGDGLSDGAEVKLYGTNPLVSNKGDIAPRGAPNGQVDLADLLILSRFVAGLDVPSDREKALADMNGVGVLDTRDMLLLRQQLGF